MKLQNIVSVVRERRLPYFVSFRLDVMKNQYFFFKNKIKHLWVKKKGAATANEKIMFICGFHGMTGGVFAIATIANLLTEYYRIEFLSFPDSFYNRLLDDEVLIVDKLNFDADLFISDATSDKKILKNIKVMNKSVIVSCHSLPYSGHGLKPEDIKSMLKTANKVHFVSQVQQDSFKLENNKYIVIPNTTKAIKKTNYTYNVGIVGNLNNDNKNADESVSIAMDSVAEEIHLWYIDQNRWQDQRVVIHSWESDKQRIYNSFDVMVFMSKSETFGLVVIEAMSAGIPCLLSAIPAFEQFSSCPGVKIIDTSNRHLAADFVNDFLRNKERLRPEIIRWWQKRYDRDSVGILWKRFISEQLSRV